MSPDQEKLFDEFPSVPTSDWEAKIHADLKGADYDRKLVWNTEEGFPIRPYYREEDLQASASMQSLPGEPPFTRGNQKKGNSWIIREDIPCHDLTEANRLALEAIRKGTDAIGLCAKEIRTHQEMTRMLEGIDLGKTGIHFTHSRSFPLTSELLVYELNRRNLSGDLVTGSINFDPVSYLLLNGAFHISKDSNFEEAEYLLSTALKKLPRLKIITVNGHFFREAGSTIVQELAFSLASANEYLAELTGRGFSADDVLNRMIFSFGIGPDYFPEIAKLRAARFLWSGIAAHYEPVDPRSAGMYIHSRTGSWNKTLFDPYVNMLRTMVEGLSAAIAGSDLVTVDPYDWVFNGMNPFSSRIARNQQLILKEESYIDRVADPAAGSYYIENLTHSIAQHAWKLFLEVEERGGMIKSITSGFIQDTIEQTAMLKREKISKRKIRIIGTNQYPDPGETLEKEPEEKTATRRVSGKTPFKTLNLFRASEEFEKLRLDTERFTKAGNKKPQVFLLSSGNPLLRKARADFASGFFGCAGFEIEDPPAFASPQKGALAAAASDAEILVICSSDEEYGDIVPIIAGEIKKMDRPMLIVVAGNPGQMEEMLKTAGAGLFIHAGSNVLEVLREVQKRLEITGGPADKGRGERNEVQGTKDIESEIY